MFGLSYVYTKDLYLVITLNLINLHVKSAVLFTFYCTFHFSLCFSVKSTKTTDSTQISQFDLILHREVGIPYWL